MDEAIGVYVDAMARHYEVTALWSTTHYDEQGNEMEQLDASHTPDDIDDETRERMRADCEDFARSNWADLRDMDPEQAGHDFWLTRHGHGAGFWDRGLGERGERLTANAKLYGDFNLYVGDDGTIYGA